MGREFFVWPEERRRLFGGIGLQHTPATKRGEAAIRGKLAELHQMLLGVTAAADSPDVEEAYGLFLEVWERKRAMEGDRFPGRMACGRWDDFLYYEGVADDAVNYDNWGRARLDLDRTRDLGPIGALDPGHVARTWVVTLAFLLTDYRYLYF